MNKLKYYFHGKCRRIIYIGKKNKNWEKRSSKVNFYSDFVRDQMLGFSYIKMESRFVGFKASEILYSPN